jgi:hypothetical protein
VPTWLGDEWLTEAAALCDRLPTAGPASGVVDLAIATAPRKEVHVHWGYSDGVAQPGAVGPAAEPSLSITLSAADAASIFDGSVEPSVSFMRGRLKAAGDGALLLSFLRSTASTDFESWRNAMAALGPYGA